MLKKTIIYSFVLVFATIYASQGLAHSVCANKRVGSPNHNPRVNNPGVNDPRANRSWEYKADKNHNGFVGPVEAKKWHKKHGHKHHPGCGHQNKV